MTKIAPVLKDSPNTLLATSIGFGHSIDVPGGPGEGRIGQSNLSRIVEAPVSMNAKKKRVGRPKKYNQDLVTKYLEDKSRLGPIFNQAEWCVASGINDRTLRRYLADEKRSKFKSASDSPRHLSSQIEAVEPISNKAPVL